MNNKFKKLFMFGLIGTMLFGIFVPLSNNVVNAETVNKIENVEDDYTVQKVTPTQMVEVYAKDNNITFDEALNEFPKNFLYQFRSNDVEYRIYTRTLNATNWFRPQIKLYVKEVGGAFNQVYNASLISYGKVFAGKVYINVENGRSIYFDVNGNFYNTGNMSYSFGASIGVGAAASVNFSVSGSNNHHAWIAFDGHFRK